MSKARELAELIGNAGGTSEQVLSGRRNLIINGAMQVAQRGTSFTNIGSNTYQLDRFGVYKNEGTLNVAQSTDAPAGFNNSLLVTVATAGAIDTTSVLGIFQNIEGYTATGLQWDGKGDPQQATASFYIKSSVAGKYSFRIRLGGVGTFVKSFTIDTANVWEYKTVTIPASPYTVPNTTNGNAMTVGISFGAGSNYHAVDGVWGTSDEYGVAGQADFIGTTNASLYLTGVQLELGSVATPFEHRSYGEELALCQRYYERCGSGIVGGTSSNMSAWNSGVTFKVEKRVPPSVTHLSNFNAITPGSNQHTVSVSTLRSYTTWGACLTHTASGSAASNQCWLYYESSNNIAFDAEL